MSKTKPKKSKSSHIAPEALLDGLSSEELTTRLSGDPTKAERIEMRVTPAEKELIQRLADHCGVSVTRLLVGLAEAATSRVRAIKGSKS